VLLLQDIIEDDEIKLDWLFKASLVYDLANVSASNLLLVKFHLMNVYIVFTLLEELVTRQYL